jgi:GDPmannose 4,6-dehydratase
VPSFAGRVLITGVTGQTGSYLAEFLAGLERYEVWGMVRGQALAQRVHVQELVPALKLVEGDLLDQGSLVRALDEALPDQIYHLGAISSPGICWKQPVLASQVTGLGTLRLLEAVEQVFPDEDTRLVVAGSIATHGPYGAAKSFSRAISHDYRRRGRHVSVALLGGHHSPRRGLEFFSRKVAHAAAEIAAGRRDSVTLGNLDRMQDWGWADDFAVALTHVMNAPAPDDYVVSTGHPHSAAEWVAACFGAAGLDFQERVHYDPGLSQPTEPEAALSAPPDDRLGWIPHRDLAGLAAWMVNAEGGKMSDAGVYRHSDQAGPGASG